MAVVGILGHFRCVLRSSVILWVNAQVYKITWNIMLHFLLVPSSIYISIFCFQSYPRGISLLNRPQKWITTKWHLFEDTVSRLVDYGKTSGSSVMSYVMIYVPVFLSIDWLRNVFLYPAAVKLFWSSFSLKFWTSFCHSPRFDPLISVWDLSLYVHCLTCTICGCSYLDLLHVHVIGCLGIIILLFFFLYIFFGKRNIILLFLEK